MYQMVIKYAKIFHDKIFQNLPKLGFCFETNHLATLPHPPKKQKRLIVIAQQKCHRCISIVCCATPKGSNVFISIHNFQTLLNYIESNACFLGGGTQNDCSSCGHTQKRAVVFPHCK
jgi:hypothetical protein